MAETKNPNQIVVNHSKNVFPEGETYTLYDLQSGSNGWRNFMLKRHKVVAKGYTDPRRVAAIGISRGGFLACHLAAAEPRIKVIAAISPLVDLMALREFKGANAAAADKYSLARLAPIRRNQMPADWKCSREIARSNREKNSSCWCALIIQTAKCGMSPGSANLYPMMKRRLR